MRLLERARTELIGDDDSTPADTDGPTIFCRSAFSERIEGGPYHWQLLKLLDESKSQPPWKFISALDP